MTELERLKHRLYVEMGVKNFSYTLGDDADLTVDQVVAQLHIALDEIEAGNYDEMPPLGDSRRLPVSR